MTQRRRRKSARCQFMEIMQRAPLRVRETQRPRPTPARFSAYLHSTATRMAACTPFPRSVLASTSLAARSKKTLRPSATASLNVCRDAAPMIAATRAKLLAHTPWIRLWPWSWPRSFPLLCSGLPDERNLEQQKNLNGVKAAALENDTAVTPIAALCMHRVQFNHEIFSERASSNGA